MAPVRLPAIVPASVSMGSDALAYIPRTKELFMGEVISAYQTQPWKPRLKESLRNGDTVWFFRNGTTKSVQRYRLGEPIHAAIYHPHGKLKMQLEVEIAGGTPGLYRRCSPDALPHRPG